jgi:molybdenum cofactor cytidylyltransferase
MITAIILAAGKSTRMGQNKLLLPWKNITVIEYVVSVFINAGIENIVVVTGGEHERVEKAILKHSQNGPVHSVYNELHESGEMLSSIQCGLRYLTEKAIGAAMIGLGDQPQAEVRSVRVIKDAYLQTKSPLVVPSFQMRRGHPWLVARSFWDEILQMQPPQTPRHFLNRHAEKIHYVATDTSSVLADLDTPEDYHTYREEQCE